MDIMQGENPPTHHISKKILGDMVVSLEKSHPRSFLTSHLIAVGTKPSDGIF